MAKTVTTKYDVSRHLRTPKEMAAYLEMCIEESNGDAAFIAKALGTLPRLRLHEMPDCKEKVYIRRFPVKEVQVSIQFSK